MKHRKNNLGLYLNVILFQRKTKKQVSLRQRTSFFRKLRRHYESVWISKVHSSLSSTVQQLNNQHSQDSSVVQKLRDVTYHDQDGVPAWRQWGV